MFLLSCTVNAIFVFNLVGYSLLLNLHIKMDKVLILLPLLDLHIKMMEKDAGNYSFVTFLNIMCKTFKYFTNNMLMKHLEGETRAIVSRLFIRFDIQDCYTN